MPTGWLFCGEWGALGDPDNHGVLKLLLLLEGFANIPKLERENDLGLKDATKERLDKCWDEIVRLREKHAEKVKKWFDDRALEEVPEDAAENSQRRRSC